MQMKQSWNDLEGFEYDLEKTAFLQRMTAGVTKVLQQKNPIELDLSEHVKVGCLKKTKSVWIISAVGFSHLACL